jgi:ribosomal RNA-processing protein 7
MSKKSENAKPFIKGYLPVRLVLGSRVTPFASDGFEEQFDDVDSSPPVDETFFYVKEHNLGKSGGNITGNVKSRNATLFVTNCPIVPNIRTKLLLQSIFGRYGEVIRVSVIPKIHSSSTNHHQISTMGDVNDDLCRWTTRYAMKPDLYPPIPPEEEGQFAHVVFSSTKEMKRAFRALQHIMSPSSSKASASTILPGVSLDSIELQTLADASDRESRLGHSSMNGDGPSKSNVYIVAEHCRKSCQTYADRLALLNECNAVMEAYEDEEEAAERRKREMASIPDEDGFITVSYTADVGRTHVLENTAGEDGTKTSNRRGTKRIRSNKKKNGGAQPLPDFYRFQTREHRQKSVQELRSRFEDDLKRIQKLKEER